MNPVPLADPTGAVCAWRCGRCGQAYAAVAGAIWPHDVPGYLAWQAEHSKSDAERCCTCHECGVELPVDENSGECEACVRTSALRCKALLDDLEREELARDEVLCAKALNVAAARQLRDLMSELSEEAYCAEWLDGLEHILWRLVVEGPDPEPAERGHGFDSAVREAQVAELRRLSDKAGGWWVWSREGGGALFVTLQEWRERCAPSVAPPSP